MSDWIEEFAGRLGEDAVTPEEMGELLKLAREVAHGTEDRRLAPLSTFLAGVHAGRAGNGAGRVRAVADALASARALLPSSDSGKERGEDRR